MKSLIVTLLSDQTIPNVQFIKEKQNEETDFLFVSTSKMEQKRFWIQKVCHITDDKVILMENVNEFSLDDIETKLNQVDYSKYQNIYVNITGGTKLMSIGVTDFFRAKNADIYYITGKDCWHLFPESKRYSAPLKDNITLKDYVESYGFEMKEGSLSGIDFSYTQNFLFEFLKFRDNDWRVINQLREKRGKSAVIRTIAGLQDFLCNIQFPLSEEKFLCINKNEIKYLTGDWFEEYIYYRLKQELLISENNIKTGITLTKNNIPNEFDIVFLWNGNLYTIECKTSIINKAAEEMNILNETIYKATAIQKNLGLYSKFSIFTLSSKESKEVKETHLERGKLFNIDVYSREDIMNCQNIPQLLKLKSC